MVLWVEVLKIVWAFRPAVSRTRTFLWMVTFLCGLCIREENLGVTSVIRAFGLRETFYRAILRMFHSDGLSLEILTLLWIKMVFELFEPLTICGRVLLVIDGIKVGKEGRKMPAVKKLHQGSNGNTKPEFISGHSFQALALLVQSKVGAIFAIPSKRFPPRLEARFLFSL